MESFSAFAKAVVGSLVFLSFIDILAGAPVFTVSPSRTEYISPSNTLDVVCATQDPSTITWHIDDANKTLISPGGKFDVIAVSGQRSRLHVGDTTSLTFGELQTRRFCRATDSSGNIDSESFILAAGHLPAIDKRPIDPTVATEGDDVTLECSFSDGVPDPDIFWTFTARGNSMAKSVGSPSNGATSNDLPLAKIRRDQAGTYVCYLRNEFGNVSASAVVTVNYLPNVTVHFDPSRRIKNGDSVTITCQSDSLPLATSHSLLRNGSPIPENSPTKAPSNTPTETVIEWSYVITASNETEGMYQCEANNSVGNGKSSKEELIVLLPPDTPTLVSSDASDLCWSSGFLGRPAITNYSVSCNTKTNNLCTNQPAKFSTTVKAVNFTTVNNVSGVLCTDVDGPSAEYTCTIEADNGAFKANTSADVSTRPGSPSSVSITDIVEVTNTGFIVNWCVGFPGSDASLSPTIIGVSLQKATFTYDSQTQQGTTTVKDLDPDTSYTIAIGVLNSYGDALTEDKTQRTSCVPDNLNVSNAKAVASEEGGTVTITFTDSRSGPCNTNNEYVIRNGNDVWGTVQGQKGENNVVTIEINRDIVSDETYELTIAAKNGDFESARSAAVQLDIVKEPTKAPVAGTSTPTPSSGGGLSTGALVGIIVGAVVIVVIIVIIIVCVVMKKSTNPEWPDGRDGKFKKKDPEAPGPNSGSSHSPSKSANPPKSSTEMTYAELDLADKRESTPVQSTPKNESERVEYASIDREASRRRREEAKKQVEEEGGADVRSSEKNQPDETELSTMV